jgi:hypothetical protein
MGNLIAMFHRLIPSALACLAVSIATAQSLPILKVSENHRFLVTDSGRPFFYLGDTAWELFHRLNREEADRYLSDRAAKGFSVIQAVALAEIDGLTDPNPYGFTPLTDNDPLRPAVKDGPDNDYWDHVDWIVDRANALGLYVGFLPTWGDKWNPAWAKNSTAIFNPSNAETYGEWIGRRYKDKGLIWVLGGDRPLDTPEHIEVIRAMARGLRRGDGGTHLITYHPVGGSGSADKLHDEPWLDFNMRQNGHTDDAPFSIKTFVDYQRTPIKPIIDAEPIYEDHPVAFKGSERGYAIAADARRTFYWDTFAGACGHTYGHHAVWQMFDSPKRAPLNGPVMPWHQAIHQPGAGQLQIGRRLLESRPILDRIPDSSIIVPHPITTNAVPGNGLRRFVATRDGAGTYAMVYAPVGRAFRVRMSVIQAPSIKAWWFNPRTGAASFISTFANSGEQEFISPDPGEMLDWVLVLDDASKNYPPPGTGQFLR